MQVATDQAAIIPAATPPIFGQTTVSAHAIGAGSQGNIPAYNINQACCATAILAKNTTPFQGGAEARNYVVVTRADIDAATRTITATLEKSEHAALAAQLNPGEEVITPPCSTKVTTDHQPGEEARNVLVTVAETCSAGAYNAHDLHSYAARMIRQQATKQLGTGYRLISDLQVSIVDATITDNTTGSVIIVVKLDAIYVYQLSPGEQQQFMNLIAGKPKQQAVQALLQVPGIQGVAITMNGNAATVPENKGVITVIVVYRSAYVSCVCMEICRVTRSSQRAKESKT